MLELILISAIALVGCGLLLVWMASPWRGLIAWVCLLSVQLPYELFFSDFRPALSDLFLPSMVLGLLFSQRKSMKAMEEKRSVLSTLVIAFAGLFLTVGNTMTYLDMGTIPKWTWLNKDIGLLDLALCFFAFLRLVDSREKLHAIVRVFVLSGSAINLLALVGGVARYVFGIPNPMMRESGALRLCGFMVNPNSYGGFLLCVLLLQFAMVLGGVKLPGLSGRVQYANLALLGMACLMTQSRSTLLGLMVGMIGLLAFFRVKVGMRLTAVALMIVLGMYAVVHRYAASQETSSDFWGAELGSNTILARLDTNAAAWHMYLESPKSVFLGIGVGTFLIRGQDVLGLPLIIHNDVLWLLVEVGPLGLFLFCAMFAMALRNCAAVARSGTADSALAAGIACSLLGTLAWTIGTEGLWHRHVWFLLALSESCYRLCPTNSLTPLLRRPMQLFRSRDSAGFPPSPVPDGTPRAV